VKIQYLQHVPYEPPANIAAWARDRGHEVEGARLYAGDGLPSVDGYDWLVVMGGPMSVHDADEHPWLADEKRLVRETVDAGKPVLGVCLGAQVLAEALGAEVRGNEEEEIGWFPVSVENAEGTPFEALPDEFEVFHWHGETFGVPDGARRTAKSEACANQAFVLGDAVGLQFHLEATRDSVKELVGANEPGDGEYVQTPEEMLTDAPFKESRERLYAFMDAYEERVARG
jgi:GMP synthase (glutamine-hydrolysing)